MSKIIRITESDLTRIIKRVIREKQYGLVSGEILMEGILPPTLMKLFGLQTAKKMDQIFVKEISNIELFFAKIISSGEKNLVTKSGQQYLRSSIGDYPSSSIKSIIDLAISGKINRANMDQYLNLLPEKFYNGSLFRENIRKLLDSIVIRVERGVGKTAVAQKVETQVSKVIPKGSFPMGSTEDSGKLAYWLDKKFYEANDKRHDNITDVQIGKMITQTKSYILNLLDNIKDSHPNFRNGKFYSPANNSVMETENDLLKMATQNMWGGFGRPGILLRKFRNKEPIPSLPIPPQSVKDNLNSIFPDRIN